MKRSGFKRRTVPRVRVPAVPIPPETAARIRYSGAANAEAVPKENAAVHKGYRQLVASMPCIRCIKPGPSQCAHANVGKGMAIKTDDRMTFPLCPACHTALDQGAAYRKDERRLLEVQWANQTRALITRLGLWPTDLPAWPGDLEQAA